MNDRRFHLVSVLSLTGAVLLSSVGLIVYARSLTGEDSGADLGIVRGKVSLAVSEVHLASLGPTVVFLEPQDASTHLPTSKKPALIDQKEIKFIPDFLVVSVGQTVEMPNNDKVMHNAFSFSKPNEFDLGIYPRGESKDVIFKHPGVVDMFCSIHARMNAIIFVAPCQYHARVDSADSFEIRGVPPGKYFLKTWNRKLPEARETIEVLPGKTEEVLVKIQTKK